MPRLNLFVMKINANSLLSIKTVKVIHAAEFEREFNFAYQAHKRPEYLTHVRTGQLHIRTVLNFDPYGYFKRS